ncbi:S9 family peptidase [Streptomyces sp. NPDC059373]
MQPGHIAHTYSLSSPSIAPDGSAVLVARRRPALEQDGYTSEIWYVPTAHGERPRRYTHGRHDMAPAFSPDGRWVAFLRAAGGPPQLHVLPTAGGDARRLTDHPMGAGVPVWSPDSRRIAYTARVPEPGRYGDGGVRPEQEPARLITELQVKADGLGWTVDRPSKLFVLDLPEQDEPVSAPSQLLDDRHAESSPSWCPESDLLVFVSSRLSYAEVTPSADIHVIRHDGTGLRRLTDGSTVAVLPSFGEDGSTVYFGGWGLTESRFRFDSQQLTVWTVPVDGELHAPAPVFKTGVVDVSPPITANPLGVLALGGRLYLSSHHQGAAELVSAIPDGTGLTTVHGGPASVGGFGGILLDGAPLLAVTTSEPRSPGEVILLDENGRRALTDFGTDLRAATNLYEPQERIASAPDGYPVHGWVIKPDGPGPHPLILLIHGGPHWHFTASVLDEPQVYAEAGYAVALCNPRGSSGYGHDHSNAIVDAYGTVDAADLLAFAEHVAAEPDIDTERLGVMGGSYGGWATSWLIAHTSRFTAAISERPVNDLLSHSNTGDLGWWQDPQARGVSREDLIAQSPLYQADRIHTPLLLVTGEKDLRCPPDQAERLYYALRHHGIETALLVFPGADHNLPRSGSPRHRIQRFEHILAWWARHLPTRRNPHLKDNPFSVRFGEGTRAEEEARP